MRAIQLTKQAKKKLQAIQKSAPKVAKKIRFSKYRIIYTFDETTVTVAIVDKRETVYQTFAHLIKNSNFLK